MPKRKKTDDEYLPELPKQWDIFENIAIPEAERIPKYDGTFNGTDYRGHGEGFIKFCEDIIYGFDHETNEFKPFRFAFWQKQIIKEAFRTKHGRLRYITILFSWARRHGKTEDFSMYDVYRAANYPNQQVKIGSNSATQGEETAYKWAVLFCLNSPDLRKMVDEGLIGISSEKIVFRITKSEIHNITSNEASAYGSRVSVAHITESHAAKNNNLYTALAGSVGDSKDGVVLMDSTVGAEDNIVWQLVNLYEEGGDDSLYVSYLFYDDLSDALKRSPEWISRAWLKSRHVQSLPGEFRKFHLNKPAGKADPMFTREEWQACIIPNLRAPLTPEYIRKNIMPRMEGEFLLYGAGLDRAQSYSKNPDRTVLTLTAKGFLKPKYYKKTEKTITDAYGDERETEPDNAEYWVVDSVEMPRVNDEQIKQKIREWHAKYRLASNAFERYETDDLARWCERSGLPVEPVNPNAMAQRDAFDMVYRAAAQGRLWVPESLWLLIYEGYNFSVDYSGAQPHFGQKTSFKAVVTINGEKQKVYLKDDAMKSFAWSVYGLRAKNSRPLGFAEIDDMQPGYGEGKELMDAYMGGFRY